MTPTKSSRRRPMPFSEWMARMDTEVEAMAQKVCKEPPAAKLLSGHQRRIVEMLVEHLRSLPRLRPGEDLFKKPEYDPINVILTNLFMARHPEWTKRTADGSMDINALAREEALALGHLLQNCAGRPAEETQDVGEGE